MRLSGFPSRLWRHAFAGRLVTELTARNDRTGSTDGAIIEGLGRTGRLVTSAALILFLSFAALASAPNTDIKVLGIGILLDATIVRALLLPRTRVAARPLELVATPLARTGQRAAASNNHQR